MNLRQLNLLSTRDIMFMIEEERALGIDMDMSKIGKLVDVLILRKVYPKSNQGSVYDLVRDYGTRWPKKLGIQI